MRRRVPGMTLVPGATFDLEEDENGVAYDTLQAADRQRIRDRVRRDRPFLVVGSPCCRDYCLMQVNLNHPKMSPEERRRRLIEREVMLRFAVEIYAMQLAAGRHFLHEHPRGAESWQEPFLRDLMAHPAVGEAIADQCRYGLRVNGPEGRPTLARKPTRFLSSAPAVLEQLRSPRQRRQRGAGASVPQPSASLDAERLRGRGGPPTRRDPGSDARRGPAGSQHARG